MNSKTRFVLINYVLILTTICLIHRCHSDEQTPVRGVPVLVWSAHRQTSPPFDSRPPKSTITQLDANVLRDDYVKQWPTVVAFIQRELSVEQFSLPIHFRRLNHIVSDRSLDSTFLTDVLSPIDSFKDFSVQNINDLNINTGNKVIINLPKDNLIENEELIGDLWHKINQNVSNEALFLITGRQNTDIYDESNAQNEVNQRSRRAVSRSDDSDRVVSIESCLFYFMRSLSVTHTTRQPNPKTMTTKFDSIPKPSTGDSRCWNSKNKEPAVLDVTYKNSDAKIRITLTIDSMKSGYWEATNGTVVLTANGKDYKYELNVKDIGAGNKFSYSCSRLKITCKDDPSMFRLVFTDFQLQPFENQMNKKYVFTSSESCEVWMTIPLWMGLITLSLMTIILLIGLYMLWSVQSPDRFENPKGKPLIVATADE